MISDDNMSKEKPKQACSALKQLQVEPEYRDGHDPQRKTASRFLDASWRNRMRQGQKWLCLFVHISSNNPYLLELTWSEN